MSTGAVLRAHAEAICEAVLPHIGAPAVALELARNYVQALQAPEPDTDDEKLAIRLISHRARYFGLRCGDWRLAARAMATTWRRLNGPLVLPDEEEEKVAC